MIISSRPSQPTPPIQRKVDLVYSRGYASICDRLRQDRGKYSLVLHLLNAYGLMKSKTTRHCRYRVIQPRYARFDQMSEFHDVEYLQFIQDVGENEAQESLEQYGLLDDCCVFPGLWDYMRAVTGSSLCAVQCLKSGSHIAINWGGGRHHAGREEAAGFCYVNDIVISILSLLEDPRFERILYIDLDAHHGDAVEEAFLLSDRVFTVSFHLKEQGFYPGTGSVDDIGKGRGAHHNLNVPLKAGASDYLFKNLANLVTKTLIMQFDPSAIVVQCGVDALARDPTKAFNLSSNGFINTVEQIIQDANNIPILILGGGGYNPVDAARVWTGITASCALQKLDHNIPDHDKLMRYKPDFELHFESSPHIKSKNDSVYINDLVTKLRQRVVTLRSSKLRKKMRNKADGRTKKLPVRPDISNMSYEDIMKIPAIQLMPPPPMLPIRFRKREITVRKRKFYGTCAGLKKFTNSGNNAKERSKTAKLGCESLTENEKSGRSVFDFE